MGNGVNVIIKIIVAVALMYAVTGEPEYGYYTMLRWLVCASCVYFAYNSYENSRGSLLIYFAAIALLFNPFIKVPLGKDIWHIVDIAVAGITLLTIFFDLKKIQK